MPGQFVPKASKSDAPEATEAIVSTADLSEAGASARHASLIDSMREHLNAQPKVEVKVRSDGDVPVQINGYTYLIQPNVKVRVPASVAKLLEEGDYI